MMQAPLVVWALASGRGIKKEAIQSRPQGMLGEITQFGGNKVGKQAEKSKLMQTIEEGI